MKNCFHESFLTTRQKTKIKSIFTNNMQLTVFPKMIQSGGFSGKTGNLGQKALLDLTVPLAEDVLPKLATRATSSIIDTFERKINGEASLNAGKGFILFI